MRNDDEMEKVDLEKLSIEKDANKVILDLGANSDRSRWMNGAITVDVNASSNPDVIYDLNKFPYPFEDSTVDVIHISHCLEHLDDPVRFLEEAYRIMKNGGLMIIKVPHFSSATSFSSLVHKNYFGINTFQVPYTPNYKFFQESVKLHYCVYRTTMARKVTDGIMSFFANVNSRFCERVWCYWVGGFSEIEFKLRKVKI